MALHVNMNYFVSSYSSLHSKFYDKYRRGILITGNFENLNLYFKLVQNLKFNFTVFKCKMEFSSILVVSSMNTAFISVFKFKIQNLFSIFKFKLKFTSILMVSSANTAFISVFKFKIQNWFTVFKFKLKFRYNFTYMMRAQFEVDVTTQIHEIFWL